MKDKNICCKTMMDVDPGNYERVCRKCTRVKELDGASSGTWCTPSYPRLDTHLVKILNKYRISDAVSAIVVGDQEVGDLTRVRFLANVIQDFSLSNSKSVNYICFIYDYFEAVPSEGWPRKEEILERLSPHLPKIPATRCCAKERFDKWWETIPK